MNDDDHGLTDDNRSMSSSRHGNRGNEETDNEDDEEDSSNGSSLVIKLPKLRCFSPNRDRRYAKPS
jgi:hypothetical protein